MSRRPLMFDDYLGQESVKLQLKIAIEASKRMGKPLKHTLFYGNPGLGKTTLANIIANEMGSKFISIVASNLKTKGDIVKLLLQLRSLEDPIPEDEIGTYDPSAPCVVFIDEIHNIPLSIEEMFYSIMEDFEIDIETPSGVARRWVPEFTLIGATTRAGDLTRPLRDRFGLQFELQDYSSDELAELLMRFAKRNSINVTPKATRTISRRARGVARIAIHFLESCRDLAIIYNDGRITSKIAKKQFDIMGIDPMGLNQTDYKVLDILASQSRPVGLPTLASAVDIDRTTLETIVEPFLAQKRLIERTSRGRTITRAGLQVIDREEVTEDMARGGLQRLC